MPGTPPAESPSPPSFALEERAQVSKLSLEHLPGSATPFIHAEDIPIPRVEDAERGPPSPQRRLFNRGVRSIASHHPRAFSWIQRAVLYIRGPRPKTDLPPITPLLDGKYRIRTFGVSLNVESTLIKFTRPFTSPWLFALLAAVYIIGFAFFSRAQSFLTPPESFIGCTSTYWLAHDGCGLNGEQCGPFENVTFDFRCPAQCDNVILQNPRTVGDEQIAFVPLIVGGGDDNRTYRGDSFICAAAVQAGVISSSRGGCGSLDLTGNFTNFLPWSQNGLSSIGFSSVFPLSYRFRSQTSLTTCTDLRNEALAFNILITCVLFILLRPKALILFWSLVCIGFWHVVLFSQPMGPPPRLDIAFGTFLPTLFISYGFWHLAYRFVLPEFAAKAPLETCILFLLGFWPGVLYNLTFDQIPISRLLSSDISKRPGGFTAFIIVLIIVVILVINQIRVIRKTGWLPHYFKWYIAGGLIILVLAFLPGLQLRLHHYIIPMALLPGTAWRTRLGVVYQGLLLGMFLNGGAAFGFDSILQTPESLRQDAPMGSILPSFLTNSTNWNTSIPITQQIIQWQPIIEGDSWEGFNLLVDDVLRFSGQSLNYSLSALQEGIPHFFRLAFTGQGQTGDFTMPAILWPNGTWVDPLPGPS